MRTGREKKSANKNFKAIEMPHALKMCNMCHTPAFLQCFRHGKVFYNELLFLVEVASGL